MSATKILFKLIDYFGYIPQNTYRNKNAIIIAKKQVYCDANLSKCTLDIYSNKGAITTPQPVLINLHGGGFVAGDKKYRKSFSAYCTKFGIKVLNVNYGLAPKRNFRQIISEVACLFDWIKLNGEKYCLDSSKIFLCGDSAGAYIAACIAALATNQSYAEAINLPKIDTKISGLILFSGIYFPTTMLDKRMILGINHALWEYLVGEKYVDVAHCSQYKFFKAIDVGNYITDDMPPVFLSYSAADIFCVGNGEKYVEQLSKLHIPHYAVHSEINMHDWQENMFTKSAKLTLAHFDKFMNALLDKDKIISTEQITISRKKKTRASS